MVRTRASRLLGPAGAGAAGRRVLAAAVLAACALAGSHRAEAAWNAFARVAEEGAPAPVIDLQGEQRFFVSYHLGVQTTILQPRFTGKASEFGIVIPVPALPDFSASIEPEFFEDLLGLTGPMADRSEYTPGLDAGALAPGGEAEVVETAEFDIYRARVLDADSITALTSWLDENGFRYDTAARNVFEYYITKGGWYFIALEVNTKAVSKDAAYDGYLRPIVIRYAIDQITIPMRIAYLQADKQIHWTVYLDTAVGVEPPPGATADFDEVLDDARLAAFGRLSPTLLPGDVLMRLQIPLAGDKADDFFLQVPVVPREDLPPGEDAAGCSIAAAPAASRAGAASLAASLLALLGIALVARRRAR